MRWVYIGYFIVYEMGAALFAILIPAVHSFDFSQLGFLFLGAPAIITLFSMEATACISGEDRQKVRTRLAEGSLTRRSLIRAGLIAGFIVVVLEAAIWWILSGKWWLAAFLLSIPVVCVTPSGVYSWYGKSERAKGGG
jgi:hypothetical protein